MSSTFLNISLNAHVQSVSSFVLLLLDEVLVESSEDRAADDVRDPAVEPPFNDAGDDYVVENTDEQDKSAESVEEAEQPLAEIDQSERVEGMANFSFQSYLFVLLHLVCSFHSVVQHLQFYLPAKSPVDSPPFCLHLIA